MQEVFLDVDEPSEQQRELARRGHAATYRASRVLADPSSLLPGVPEPLARTNRRLLVLGAQVAAYLARTLSRPKAVLPRYELAADVARLWAPDRGAAPWSGVDATRAAYVTLVAATAGDVVWTEWEWSEARTRLAITLVGAADEATSAWRDLRDQGIELAQRSGFDLASAAEKAAFWTGLREGFTVGELAELLRSLPAGDALVGTEVRDRGGARQEFDASRSREVPPPGPPRRLLAQPLELSLPPINRAESEAEAVRALDGGRRRVRVWFVTNRATSTDGWFENGRSATTSYGYADFLVGRSATARDVRQTGVANDASCFTPASDRPMVLPAADFFTLLHNGGATEQAMLYVHGYNSRFDGSLQRAAQLAWDLALDTPIIVFCWPSAGSWHRYLYDRDSVEASSNAFTEFVEQLPVGMRLDVVAHSMGNRLLAQSAGALSRRAWTARRPLRTLALAAADLGVGTYAAVAPLYAAHLSGPAAVYVSRGDRALLVSRFVNQVAVVGHGGPGTAIAPADGVDAQRVNHVDFWRHNYFAISPPVLCDLARLVHGETNHDRRARPGRPGEWEL